MEPGDQRSWPCSPCISRKGAISRKPCSTLARPQRGRTAFREPGSGDLSHARPGSFGSFGNRGPAAVADEAPSAARLGPAVCRRSPRRARREPSAVVSCAAETNQLLTEVKALVDLSRFCLFENRRRCLEVAERALVRSRALDDDVAKALVQGNHASLIYSVGWRDEDADLCRLAIKITGDARDPFVVMWRRRIGEHPRIHECDLSGVSRFG